MSLSDHLRYLRALHGGTDTVTIATAIGLELPGQIYLAETCYRPVDNVPLVENLAAYYGRSTEEFHWHNARPRKYLTFYIAQAIRNKQAVSLTLRSQEVLQGNPEWWDLSSIGLRMGDGRLLVVQRHAVIDWPEATQWENV